MKPAGTPAAAVAAKAPRRRADAVKPATSGALGFTKISADQHVISILRGAERRQYAPLDAHVRRYFMENKDAFKAPKTRREVSARVYHLTTWRGLIDHIVDPSGLKYVSWEDRLQAYKTLDVKAKLVDTTLPLHVRCSLPKPLVDKFLLQYTPEEVVDFARGSNFGAPLTLRVNPLKTTRDALIRSLKENYNFQVKATERSPLGITFVVKPMEPLQLKPEFKDGLFEIQDEASQIAALMVDPKPDQQVLDFCAGAGGKSLAFAHKVTGKGALHLHDIPPLLNEAQRRLKRAGVTNAHFYALDDKYADEEEEDGTEEFEDEGGNAQAKQSGDADGAVAADKAAKSATVPRAAEGVFKDLSTLGGKMDWVLADVPCSGSGVYRRNPDMRWRYSEETMGRLTELQRRVATTAAKFLARGGHMVYSTCSILREENEDQVMSIIKSEKMELVGDPFRSLPKQGSMDGFFAAVLRRK